MPVPPPAAEDEVARIECGTTAGDIVLELHRQWSPAGYDRAVQLFARHFYDHSHFFRTVPSFLVQFGISYNSSTSLQQLAKTPIPDDPPPEPPIKFTAGTISYAGTLCHSEVWSAESLVLFAATQE